MFAFGMLCGALVSYGGIVLYVYLTPERRNAPKVTISTLKKGKGDVLIPLDEDVEERTEYIKRQHEQGKDVFLDDIP